MLFLAITNVFGYIVRLNPKESRCFFVEFSPGQTQRISVRFTETVDAGQQSRSGQSGGRSVVASVRGPKGEIIQESIPPGTFPIVPYQSGKYHYCFLNQNATASVETEFHIAGTDLPSDSGEVKNAGKGHLDSLLRELASNLRHISNTQDFIEKHVRTHASIAHSSKGLVVLWHIIQIALVCGVIYAQTTFIKRIFEKPIKAV